MGIGTLRRYHEAQVTTGASTDAPVVGSGLTQDEIDAKQAQLDQQAADAIQAAADSVKATQDAKAKQEAADEALRVANEQRLESEQQAQVEAANGDETGAESVHEVIQEAGAVEDEPAEGAAIVELADGTVVGDGEQVVTLHEAAEGELSDATVEQPAEEVKTPEVEAPAIPNRGSSKQLWLDYSAAVEGTKPIEGIEELSRDEIADLYLGPKV